MLFPEEHPSFTNSSVWGWLIIYCQVYVTADVHQTEMYVYGFTTAFWQEMRWTYSPAALSLSLGSVGEKLFGDFTNETLAALSLLTCCICQVVSVRWFVHKLYCKWCNRRSFIFLPVCQTSLSFLKCSKIVYFMSIPCSLLSRSLLWVRVAYIHYPCVCLQIRPQEMSESCFWVQADENQYAKPDLLSRVALTFGSQRTGKTLMILSYVFDQNINRRYLEVLGKNHLQLLSNLHQCCMYFTLWSIVFRSAGSPSSRFHLQMI